MEQILFMRNWLIEKGLEFSFVVLIGPKVPMESRVLDCPKLPIVLEWVMYIVILYNNNYRISILYYGMSYYISIMMNF